MIIQWFGHRWLGQNLVQSAVSVFVWRSYGSAPTPSFTSSDDVNARLTISGINTGGTKIVYGASGGIM